MAVRFREKYLPVKLWRGGEQGQSPLRRASRPRRAVPPGDGSDWGKNFDLQKAPKIGRSHRHGQHGKPPQRFPHHVELKKWREGRIRPLPGKFSARPAGKPGVFVR